MARVIRFFGFGGPEVLQIDDVPFEPAGRGELRIRVAAFGLNRVESMYRQGVMGPPAAWPATLGSEGAGTVLEIGEGVCGFEIGDRIATLPGFSTLPGFTVNAGEHPRSVYADEAYIPAEMAVKLPSGLSFIEGASIWMRYATAYAGLIHVAQLKAGEVVLVTAASSSVGIAAIEIANAVGAIPIATTRNAAKSDALRHHGARHVIVTSRQDIAGEVARITQGAGANLIFDAVGGAGVADLIDALARFGRIVVYGAFADTPLAIPIAAAVAKAATVHFTSQFEVTCEPAARAALIRFVLDGIEAGRLRPTIHRIFPFDQIVEAHRYLEDNSHVGKIVIEV